MSGAGKVGATATCEHCAWQATMIGDSPIEVGTFLRARLIEHCEQQHPERFVQDIIIDEDFGPTNTTERKP